MVVERRRNQEGESTVVWEITFENGVFVEGRLNCSSSADYGFGTCRCQSHLPWSSHVVCREHVRRIIAGAPGIVVSPEELEALKDESLETRIREVLGLKGLTQKNVDKWLTVSYALDENPLPALRRFLKDAGIEAEVKFGYSNHGDIPGTYTTKGEAQEMILVLMDEVDERKGGARSAYMLIIHVEHMCDWGVPGKCPVCGKEVLPLSPDDVDDVQ